MRKLKDSLQKRRDEGQATSIDPNTRAVLASIAEQVEETERGPRQTASRGRKETKKT